MTAIVEISEQAMEFQEKSHSHPLDNGDYRMEEKSDSVSKENDKAEVDTGCLSKLDGGAMTAEVKIDMEASSVVEEKEKSSKKKQVMLPSQASTTSVHGSQSPEEFCEDAQEVSTRVYDFNMVKQKTLPRISFGTNQIFDVFSSHSKSYVLVWTLMPISLVICIIVLILYFMPH